MKESLGGVKEAGILAEMKSVNRQRILILTLGTGDIISYNKDEKRLDKPKDIEERARRIEAGFDNEDGYFYINTNYLMEGVKSDGKKEMKLFVLSTLQSIFVESFSLILFM